MNKLAISAIAATTLMVAVAPSAQAGSFDQTFDVTVTLTSACQIQGGGPLAAAPSLDFGTYNAFQTTDNTATDSFTIECTRNLAAPTYTFDTTNGAADGSGTVAGLAYTVTATNSAATGGSDATSTVAAVSDKYTVTLDGTMVADQPGQDNAATTVTRTLTITY